MRDSERSFSLQRGVQSLYDEVEREDRKPEYFLIRLVGTLLRVLGWSLTLGVMFWLIYRGAITKNPLYMASGLLLPIVVAVLTVHVGPKYFEWFSVKRLLRWARERLSVGALSGSATSVMIPGTTTRPSREKEGRRVDDA